MDNKKDLSRSSFKRRDMLLIVILFLLALVFYLIPRLRKSEGAIADVYVGSEIIRSIDITNSPDETFTITGNLTVHIRVEDGCIFFLDSECPDKICINTGKLRKYPDTAVCLPAEVSICIRPAEDDSFYIAG